MIQPGDIGFARTTGIMGRLIRLGEWLKFRKSDYNHMFVVAEDGIHIIQATLRGVTDTALLTDVAPGGKYFTMSAPSEVDIAKLLEFCRAQVGSKYSFLTIMSIAFDTLTWNWVPALMNSYRQSWVCSGLTCEALRYGGWLFQVVNIYTITPQTAYDALTD